MVIEWYTSASMPTTTPDLYARVYASFDAPVTRFDCGQMCSPHNGGEPVCCSTKHAVPIDLATYNAHREAIAALGGPSALSALQNSLLFCLSARWPGL